MKFILFFIFLYSFSSYGSSVSFEWNHFTSAPADTDNQLDDYLFLELDYDFDRSIGPFQMIFRFIGEYSVDSSKLVYMTVPEVYSSYRYQFFTKPFGIESLGVSLGRKIRTWSIADEYWEFGQWNPLSRWNSLHPFSNGLVGSFLNIEGNNWSIDILVGGVHIPSSEASSSFQSSKIVSSSRWFVGVPEQVDLFQLNVLDIEYYMERPFIFDILFQQSYIVSFKTWLEEEQNMWMKWVFGYKPVNDLFIITNSILDISKGEDQKESISQGVTVLPTKQRLVSAEWGIDYKDFSSVFSFGSTFVNSEETQETTWESVYSAGYFTYFSILLRYNLNTRHYLQMSYLDSWVSSDLRNGQIESDKLPFVFGQYKILKGVGFDWHWDFFNKEDLKRQIDVNYRYSLFNHGALLSVKGTYYLSPQFYISANFDIIGGSEGSDGQLFLDKFLANDYFGWKVSYVF